MAPGRPMKGWAQYGQHGVYGGPEWQKGKGQASPPHALLHSAFPPWHCTYCGSRFNWGTRESCRVCGERWDWGSWEQGRTDGKGVEVASLPAQVPAQTWAGMVKGKVGGPRAAQPAQTAKELQVKDLRKKQVVVDDKTQQTNNRDKQVEDILHSVLKLLGGVPLPAELEKAKEGMKTFLVALNPGAAQKESVERLAKLQRERVTGQTIEQTKEVCPAEEERVY